jgi:hypothetical protein
LGLGGPKGRHVKRRSVSFEDEILVEIGAGGGKGKSKEKPKESAEDGEERRRERRRSEAKAAIEVRFFLFSIPCSFFVIQNVIGLGWTDCC